MTNKPQADHASKTYWCLLGCLGLPSVPLQQGWLPRLLWSLQGACSAVPGSANHGRGHGGCLLPPGNSRAHHPWARLLVLPGPGHRLPGGPEDDMNVIGQLFIRSPAAQGLATLSESLMEHAVKEMREKLKTQKVRTRKAMPWE